MAKKHYTDRERMEIVKKFRASGMPISRYAKENGLAFSTLRDWAYAYEDLEGRFVRLDFDESDPSRLMATDDVTMHMLAEEEIRRKSNAFSRFDHSVVVIETRGVKVTTSLEQAMAILGRILG
ncbi:MAG: transposase [Bacilli bacterium]|nr:transposase [Bacilli bacterium]